MFNLIYVLLCSSVSGHLFWRLTKAFLCPFCDNCCQETFLKPAMRKRVCFLRYQNKMLEKITLGVVGDYIMNISTIKLTFFNAVLQFIKMAFTAVCVSLCHLKKKKKPAHLLSFSQRSRKKMLWVFPAKCHEPKVFNLRLNKTHRNQIGYLIHVAITIICFWWWETFIFFC